MTSNGPSETIAYIIPSIMSSSAAGWEIQQKNRSIRGPTTGPVLWKSDKKALESLDKSAQRLL